MENTNYGYNIEPEKFTLVGIREGDDAGEKEYKSVGYFTDAWSRFRKNRASVVAGIIIICIVLFATLTPIIGFSEPSDFLDPYYAKMPPRLSVPLLSRGAVGAFARTTVSKRRLSYLYSIGVGAMGKEGDVPPADALDERYLPVGSYAYKNSGVGGDFFSASVDPYLEVGFLYMNIGDSEYYDILEFEEREGVAVLFPLIAENEYNPNLADANYWYLANEKAEPITPEGQIIDFSQSMQLYGNYLYGADGELVYSRAAGGSGDDAERTVRVLYYNYYRYKNGRYPSYVFGTDSQGYDLASRLAVGVALSLLLAFSVSLINLVIGALWGAVSGYYGGRLDLVMSRVTDVLSGVPAIVVQTLFQIHLAERVGVLVSLLFAFVLTGWIATAGRVRSQFYRFKGEEYVSAARTLGASDRRIIWRHIFPNTLGTLITASVLVIPGVIFTESMLSFLGIVNLGGADITSLGTLLSEAANVWTLAPHLMLVPAAFISLLMISFNLLGGGLRDAFNPTLRGTL